MMRGAQARLYLMQEWQAAGNSDVPQASRCMVHNSVARSASTFALLKYVNYLDVASAQH